MVKHFGERVSFRESLQDQRLHEDGEGVSCCNPAGVDARSDGRRSKMSLTPPDIEAEPTAYPMTSSRVLQHETAFRFERKLQHFTLAQQLREQDESGQVEKRQAIEFLSAHEAAEKVKPRRERIMQNEPAMREEYTQGG